MHLINVGKSALQALSVGLEQPHDFLLSKHAHVLGPGNASTLRLLYYPPLGAPVQGLTRCGAHCDYGTFTLLAQVCRLRHYIMRLKLTACCSPEGEIVNNFLENLFQDALRVTHRKFYVSLQFR